jgi:hypothetical protein
MATNRLWIVFIDHRVVHFDVNPDEGVVRVYSVARFGR